MFDDWSLKLIEWSPPSQACNVKDPMRPIEFLKLTLKNDIASDSPKMEILLNNRVSKRVYVFIRYSRVLGLVMTCK